MFNPRDDRQLKRFAGVLKSSVKEMDRARANRLKFQKKILGKHSPYAGTPERRHLNFLDLAVTIYKQSLVPYHPRCSLTARRRDFAAHAYSFELAVNQVLGEDYVSEELESCVMESMLAPLGIIKIMLDAQDVQAIDDGFGNMVQVTTGTPKLKSVTFDNWIQDMSAAGPGMVAFCGDRYHIDLNADDGVFDPEVVSRLKPATKWTQDDYSSQKLRDQQYWEDYRDLVEVWDLWLPDDGLLLTLPKDFDSTPPLRIVEWTGPQQGCYERLYYGMMPGNSLPNPPVATWYDLNETANRLYNKCVNQAERQKTNDVVQSGSTEDGTLLKNAKDGDYLALSSVQGKQTIRTGGPDNVNLAFTLNAKDQFNTMSGGAFMLAGAQTGSDTVGQDQMLMESANVRLRNMQTRTRDLLRRIVKQVAEYLWNSPLVDVPIQKQAGARTIDSTWNREMMPGEWPDYLCDIDPYSLGERTPQQRAAEVDDFWRTDVPNLLPLMQAEGIMPSVEAYIKTKARLKNLPELNEMVMYMEGEMMPGQEQVQKPNTTTRKYERVSKSGGATQQGMEQQLQTKLLGSSFNNQESA